MTVSDEQVEAAAVAIAQDADWMWPMTPPDIRDIFRRQARAALTAAGSIGSEAQGTRVGFYVEVELDTDDSSAALIMETLLGWPGDWSPPNDPVPFSGKFGRNDALFTGRILRSQVLMRKVSDV